MSELTESRDRIAAEFQAAFGRTPLSERVLDILAQATSLGRFTDLANRREETGDLLCSALQLCHECGWDPEDLITATLEKVAARREIYSRLGRKLRVGLLGGAFDPIHLGHVEVAQAVLSHGGIDEVWLMPCYEHLAGKSMCLPEHRLQMCRIAARSLRGIGVFDYELLHEFRGETFHLVKNLLSEEIARLRCDFSLIIGQDNADSFSSWTNGELLERMIPFLVVTRPGCAPPQAQAWYLKSPHRYLADVPSVHAISSTQVRNLLQAGDNAATEELLPDGVLDYIHTHALYGREMTGRRVDVR